MNQHSKKLAAIDIGTNSFHLVVAQVNTATGRFTVLDRAKENVRLGSGSTDMKYLTEKAVSCGIETLKRFRRIADATNAPIRAVATSAVREALNQEEFVRRAKSEVDIIVEIASGIEEARLIYLGVLQALPVFGKQTLLVDIGGGSTEFLVGYKRKIHFDQSLKLGAVRLTEKFFADGEVTDKSIKKCRDYIRGMLQPVSRMMKKHSFDIAVGTSGTINNIAAMVRAADGIEEPSTTLNSFTFTGKELERIVEKVLGAKSAKERLKIDGLDPGRVDIIVAGALILGEIFEELQIDAMTISEYALREGILYDTLEKRFHRKGNHGLGNIRYGSVLHVAQHFHYEVKHSHQVAKLALCIFDKTKDLHELGDTEREYLEAAAVLHEVGLYISHDQHHRHSYYLIRNAELLGFTENEKEIIANVARYHRKSHPKYKHEGFRKLTPAEQMIVTRLAGILRIADGLDRSHQSLVQDITLSNRDKTLAVRIHRSGKKSDLALELWGAEQKKDLFEQTFGRKLQFALR